uniref:Lipase (Class 3) n=1 Tax=Candidatus Kentrum sp. DK TaxID=2126562 RepID=A0A450SMN4_9GAMM|nr:MAG: Lipase (class 3) [Candidatus Kentron sp. DK]
MKTISPYTTSLHPGNAYWMARLSKEIYRKRSEEDPAPDEKRILRSLQEDDKRFQSVRGVDKNSTQAALVAHQDYLCMVFRGTDELVDWLDNINAFSTKQLFGEFHRGFWHSVEDVWEVLFSGYQELLERKKRPLFITGHSLGGAMATIAAARFLHEGRPFTSVYTFGQPRALTRETARIFNAECKSRFFRFHNNNDIVTRAPARLMGYSHAGHYLYISEQKTIHPEVGFWFRFLDYFDGAFESLKQQGSLDLIADHDINEYLDAVERWNLRCNP